MRGYRDPNPDDQAENVFRFEDQFEDDSYGLTFRKFGRGRPVRVTPEERDECIDRFERLDAYFRQAFVAALIAWLVGATWLAGDHVWSNAYWLAGMIAIVLASRAADHFLWTRLTNHFARRTPVGPSRTLMDQYRSKAARLSWSTVGLAVLVGAGMLWLTDFDSPSDLLGSTHAGLALAGLLALALLKVFDRRN